MKKDQNKTPSQATRAISPEGFSSPEIYITRKMGALLGASKHWTKAPIEDEEHTVYKEQKNGRKLEQRLANKDELAIFPYIAYPNDPKNLTHPFVIESIRKWQNKVVESRDPEAKWKLEKLASSLVPDMRGKRKNVPDPEEVFKFYFEREWVWFHVLKDVIEYPSYNWDARFKFVADKYAQYGLDAEYVRGRILGPLAYDEAKEEAEGTEVRRRMKYFWKDIALDETAIKFKIRPETIQQTLSKYE
ncbi:MAG: hypothetical protein DRH11_07665 [Deltaproteobacteria bacterium]|nr:MAG: hypothetical protein DRH11_07665 [Deltaproteobacteria bacterium]